MRSFIRWLLTWFVPDGSIPPAASEYDENEQQKDWTERTHNQPIVSVTNRAMVRALKQADEQTKKRYDHMDRHVRSLCELKIKIRERKLARRRAVAKASLGHA